MSDIILLSNLAAQPNRVLQALDNAGIHTIDLLSLDVLEVHRRTQLSVIDVQKLLGDVISALTEDVEKETRTAEERERTFTFLTTGDQRINELLGGGIPTDSLTEITGESGLGKSQFCLQLCIHVQLPRSLGGLDAGVIYIGTESSLATPRLAQVAEASVAGLVNSPPSHVPPEDIERALDSLSTHGDRIFYYHCADLEAQEHIVSYQLSVIFSRHRIGLIILDSVTANYRAEFDRQISSRRSTQPTKMAQRSKDLRKLAGTLKSLAIQHHAAVVCVNQVTDSFKRTSSQVSSTSHESEDLLSLDYQARWFDGIMDENGAEGSKKPALGFVWTNLVSQRIMLVRDSPFQTRIKLVFSPFARPGSLVYELSSGSGIHAVEGEETRDFAEYYNEDLRNLDVEEILSGRSDE